MLYFNGVVPILEAMPDFSSAIKFIHGFCVHMTEKDFRYLENFFAKYTKINDNRDHLDQYDPMFTLSEALEMWTLNGRYHNYNGPAIRKFYVDMTIEREEYYVKGEKYKEYEYDYYLNYIKLKLYKNGKLHCVDGPAVIGYRLPCMTMIIEKWYINGENVWN